MKSEIQKVAWITGGGTGIGKELTKLLADDGWTIIISGRRLNKLNEVRRFRKEKIIPIKLDISSKSQCKNVIKKILGKFKSIDLVFLNAAAYNPGHLDFGDLVSLENVIDINLTGQINCLSYLMPHLKKKKNGKIVFVSSPAGFRGLPNAGIYGVTKSAITFLAESLYIEMLKFNIGVQVVHPGFVKTPMTDKNDFPMPFLMTSAEAAKRIHKKLSTNEFEIYFPKRLIWPMKLLQILPYKIYFFLMKNITKFSS